MTAPAWPPEARCETCKSWSRYEDAAGWCQKIGRSLAEGKLRPPYEVSAEIYVSTPHDHGCRAWEPKP